MDLELIQWNHTTKELEECEELEIFLLPLIIPDLGWFDEVLEFLMRMELNPSLLDNSGDIEGKKKIWNDEHFLKYKQD